MIPALERRRRQFRSRVLVRSRDYRQRRHARGVRFRLRRVLADASAAYAIPREEASVLIEDGYEPEAVGRELEPPRIILFVPRERIAQARGARPLALRPDADLLGAECLALVAFAGRP